MKVFHVSKIFAKRNTSLTVMNAFISERWPRRFGRILRFHASKYNLILPKDVPGEFAQFSRISFLSSRPSCCMERIRQLATEIALSNSLKPTHYSSMRDAKTNSIFAWSAHGEESYEKYIMSYFINGRLKLPNQSVLFFASCWWANRGCRDWSSGQTPQNRNRTKRSLWRSATRTD
jgi:hypothetical protein